MIPRGAPLNRRDRLIRFGIYLFGVLFWMVLFYAVRLLACSAPPHQTR